jgi:integrase
MVRVQQFTGMRPGEVCALLGCEISRTPAERIQVPDGPTIAAVAVGGVSIWLAAPGAHKTSWKGKVRIIAIGPLAQAELQPYLGRPADVAVFSPAGLPRCRRDFFTTDRYDTLLTRACRAAGVPHWSPNQLRHHAGDMAANAFDQHHAQAVLGHSTPSTTSTYIDALIQKAAAVAARLG